jgi:pyruvate formate-lyase activating enzyme-like uncharacterized protein
VQLVHDPQGQPTQAQGGLRFQTPEEAERSDERRRRLLAALPREALRDFHGYKPHLGPLSPGCLRCARGEWSCLFLTGVCCADCFFCPGLRSTEDRPAYAERLLFPAPRTYAQYVARLGYTGASFSGGEPFMAFDKLLAYLDALRAHGPKDLYVWAYTNGLPATPDRLSLAAAAGLDEVRFNIAHDGYRLDRVRAAVGRVARVSVEIPAIPEDVDLLKALLPELAAAGVAHLHLHQLVLLGENGAALQRRGYVFAPGSAPAVVESELCALEVLRHAAETGVKLPVQLCSLSYKDHFQAQGEGRRGASLVMKSWEEQTEAGLLRRLWFQDSGDGALPALAERLGQLAPEGQGWSLRAAEGRLLVRAELAARLGCPAPVRAVYLGTVLGEPDDSPLARGFPDYFTVAAGEARQIGVRHVPLCHPIPLSLDELNALVSGRPPRSVASFEVVPDADGSR